MFAARQTKNVHLLVRSQYKRVLKDEPQFDIHSKVAASPVRSTYKINITNRETRKKRKATIDLKYCKVYFELRFPNQYQKGLPAVTLWAIQVEEPNPPKGIKPIKWILLTSKEVTSASIAKTIVRYYELRWLVERLHYVLKVGAGVTDLQLETPQRILKAVAAYSISAVNIMRMNYFSRVHPQKTIDQIGISTLEYKALYTYAQANLDGRLSYDSKRPPPIGEFVSIIARIGGFTNYSNQPHPGLKVFWRGWKTFRTIVISYEAFFSDG